MTTSEALQAAFGYLFPNEVLALKYLARSLPGNPVVVNIGAGAGTSGLAFMESREDLQLITVDIQDEDSPFGSLYAEAQVIEQAFSDWYLRYYPYNLDSKWLGGNWDTPVDMVFIDGDHSFRGCKGDILSWLPNIKKGGIMAVHDFDKKNVYKRPGLPDKIPHPLPWPGVDRAVRKFLCPYYPIVLHIDTLIAFRIK